MYQYRQKRYFRRIRFLSDLTTSFFLVFLSLVGLIFFSFSPNLAHACECDQPAKITILPGAKTLAPRNTQVWIQLPAYNKKIRFAQYPEFKDFPNKWSTSFLLAQLSAALFINGHSVPVQQFALQSGLWRMIILQPQRSLSPNKTYQVRLFAVGGWNSPIGTIKTGAGLSNRTFPQVSVASARYLWEKPLRDSCTSTQPYAILQLAETPPKGTLFGIWMPDATGLINYKNPPNLVFPPQQDRLYLGAPTQCSQTNFIFPKGSEVKLGLRMADYSGRWSPPTLVTFSKGASLQPWTWAPSSRARFWFILGALFFLFGLLRTWLFQFKAHKLLDEFLLNYSSIKNDISWIALKKLTQEVNPLLLKNLIFAILQYLLVAIAIIVFVMSLIHFSAGTTGVSQLFITVGTLALFLFFNWGVHFLFFLRLKQRRRRVAHLPVSPNFQQAHQQLLGSWKK